LEEDAIELAEAVEILEEVKDANKEEVKKKGIAKKLRRIVEDLGNDKSTLGKTIKGMKHGVEIAQDIGKQYNKIAQWLGMPQVPGLFFGWERIMGLCWFVFCNKFVFDIFPIQGTVRICDVICPTFVQNNFLGIR